MRSILDRLLHEESGHLIKGVTAILGAAGAIVLAIGVTGDTDALVWIGAIVLAVAFINAGFIEHTQLDYPVLKRLDDLEAKQ